MGSTFSSVSRLDRFSEASPVAKRGSIDAATAALYSSKVIFPLSNAASKEPISPAVDETISFIAVTTCAFLDGSNTPLKRAYAFSKSTMAASVARTF